MTTLSDHNDDHRHHKPESLHLQDDETQAADTNDTACSASPSPSPSSLDGDRALRHRPFPCSYPGCSRRFKRKCALKDHLKSHTGEKPFVCPVQSCSKRFAVSGNLTRHKRLHPWLNAIHVCQVGGCPSTFPSDSQLQRHMVTHCGGVVETQCPVEGCSKVFSTAGNLRRHMKQKHSGYKQDDSTEAEESSQQPSARVAGEEDLATFDPLGHERCGSNGEIYDEHELLDLLSCLFDHDE